MSSTPHHKKIPLDQGGQLKPVLKILTDYPRDDLASDEVQQALITAAAHLNIDFYTLDVGAIPGMNTVVAGFKTAQLALNSALGFGHIIHTNCAPRRNIISQHSKGEGVVIGILPSGVALLIVNSGFSLAPFASLIQSGQVHFYKSKIPDEGSQFRSRDYFPHAMAELARFFIDRYRDYGADKIAHLLETGQHHSLLEGFSLLGPQISKDDFNELVKTSIYYIDNFGNLKLNINHDDLSAYMGEGAEVAVVINDTVVNATIGSVGFSQAEGSVALTRGSSGWIQNGQNIRFTEVFLRGGSAASSFNMPKTGQAVAIIRFDHLQKVFSVLRENKLKRIGPVDLYNLSEARLITYLCDRDLIKNGYDASELEKHLNAGSLVSYLTHKKHN
jgi:hypothetical protein